MLKNILGLFLSFGFQSSAWAGSDAGTPLPSHQIDMRFAHDRSVLRSTPAQTAAYNQRTEDSPKAEFAREAVLDFGSRKVRVYLIAARHENESDTKFIFDSLSKFSVNPKRARLFIESGDNHAAYGGATQVIDLIKRRSPNLAYVIDRDSNRPDSFLNPAMYATYPFAVASRKWEAHGGNVSNMDLAYNFSDEAIEFLSRNVSFNFLLEFLRSTLFSSTFDFREFRTFLPDAFPGNFTTIDLGLFKDSAPDIISAALWTIANNQVYDLVRERYMRHVLFREARDGDVVITHPAHMKHILEPECF